MLQHLEQGQRQHGLCHQVQKVPRMQRQHMTQKQEFRCVVGDGVGVAAPHVHRFQHCEGVESLLNACTHFCTNAHTHTSQHADIATSVHTSQHLFMHHSMYHNMHVSQPTCITTHIDHTKHTHNKHKHSIHTSQHTYTHTHTHITMYIRVTSTHAEASIQTYTQPYVHTCVTIQNQPALYECNQDA